MRKIDLQTWSRREHFKVYNSFDHPHFNMCANADLTAFYPYVKKQGISFNVAVIYIITRAANAIREFRYRIRAGEVIEHKVVHPSTTILTQDDLFSFCTLDYSQDFLTFAARAGKVIAYTKEHPTLEDQPGRDDLLFMTAIPWVSFTSFSHPIHLNPADSVPRFAWGKMFEDGRYLKLPLSVQGHHAVMDGIHMGRFYEKVRDYLNQPEAVLGS
jgi:chloramphenicol O-acetyltransferase type A